MGYGECGAEQQAVDYVVCHYPIHRPLYRVHRLVVLDDQTIKWLLSI